MEENNKQDKKDYNRLVCGFCPSKDVCDFLRDKHHCADCRSTILCAQTKGPGLLDCEVAQQKWKDNVPSKCLLGQQLAKDVQRIVEAREDTSVTDVVAVVCPRCMCNTLSHMTDYDWGLETKLCTKRHVSCSVCHLDEEASFG